MQRAIKIIRDCSVCSDEIKINVTAKGRYDNGHYFGTAKTQIKGTGEWKQIGTSKVLKIGGKPVPIVRWTGKIKKAEYWECNPCCNQAMRENWLEEAVEDYYGERCKDFEPSCISCDTWSLYDKIVKDERLRGNFAQKYDKSADALYIPIKPKIKKGESARTLELSDFINLDFDKRRNLLGIEVLTASRHMPKVFAKAGKQKQQ